MSGTKVKQGTEGRNSLKGFQDAFVVVWLRKRRTPSPSTLDKCTTEPHALSSFHFLYEAGSHRIVQAGLTLTQLISPSQTELAVIPPQSPFVSSYSHRPELEGAAGKWRAWQMGDILGRLGLGQECSAKALLQSLLMWLRANSDCHITGVQ